MEVRFSPRGHLSHSPVRKKLPRSIDKKQMSPLVRCDATSHPQKYVETDTFLGLSDPSA